MVNCGSSSSFLPGVVGLKYFSVDDACTNAEKVNNIMFDYDKNALYNGYVCISLGND